MHTRMLIQFNVAHLISSHLAPLHSLSRSPPSFISSTILCALWAVAQSEHAAAPAHPHFPNATPAAHYLVSTAVIAVRINVIAMMRLGVSVGAAHDCETSVNQQFVSDKFKRIVCPLYRSQMGMRQSKLLSSPRPSRY